MSFYMKPPAGHVSLGQMKQDAEIRLQFLIMVDQCAGAAAKLQQFLVNHPHVAAGSDCLIEGSARDRSSHFIMRLASLHSGQLKEFVIRSESELLKHRLNCGGLSSLSRSISELGRHCIQALDHQQLTFHHRSFIKQLRNIVNDIKHNHEMLKCNDQSCYKHSLSVPWIMVLDLVRERSVEVNLGMAVITCHTFPQLLTCICKEIIKFGMKQLELIEIPFGDNRLQSLLTQISYNFQKWKGGNLTVTSIKLTAKDIFNGEDYLPLCMKQLHKTLTISKRIGHHARFRYTLFLKDAGLPLNENVAFWQRLYSQPTCNDSHIGCQHTWAGTDASRYTYSIRHMYGLEGRKVSYCSHTCAALQATPAQPVEAGGCPFISCNEEELEELLNCNKLINSNYKKAIFNTYKSDSPNNACGMMLAAILNNKTENVVPKDYILTNNNCNQEELNNLSTSMIKQISYNKHVNNTNLGSNIIDQSDKQRCNHILKSVNDNSSLIQNDLHSNNILQSDCCLSTSKCVTSIVDDKTNDIEVKCNNKLITNSCKSTSKSPPFKKVRLNSPNNNYNNNIVSITKNCHTQTDVCESEGINEMCELQSNSSIIVPEMSFSKPHHYLILARRCSKYKTINKSNNSVS